ncbi:two-partner secretion domain-containing protein [Candidatus Marithrix sp. Canyon 246]|uniref:two-partner secretion domain-containing protein n=1 Tax=Candidatus Marithrix sp. Canyon 246 TaxID=1827136 RepID=UPI00084A161B|nr:filamentous hemagglutinin N-terminal domain-containing protein [Candidatus Marithrix sp. Canyon 246]
MKKYFFLIILILNPKLYAEIITDGTIGQRNHLIGPNFIINEQLGLQVGNNLFHSFQIFNIETGQTATFSSSSSVTNILARVTGNQSSWIDGRIISDANLYLLNPNGIVFGENARLSINGSFHASTADYLRLGNTGKFSASHPQESILTVASPEAFGFLTAPSSITIEGSAMMVPQQQTISVIGGDLFIKDSFLFAESGKINLASVASSGEVVLKPSDLIVDSFEKMGQIHLSESRPIPNEERLIANLDVSDIFSQEAGAGQIFIRAGKFISDKAWIFADTYGNQDGLGIDILIDGNINLINGARITTDNGGTGQGGNIKIQANNLTLSGINSNICNESCQRNSIENQEDYINSLSTIASNTFGMGNGGEIIINASSVEMQPGFMQTATKENGRAGNIDFRVDNLKLYNNSYIDSSTEKNGKAGNITLNTQQLILENQGKISASSEGNADAGSINITTKTASFSNKSGITTQSFNTSGGNIEFTVTDRLYLSDNSRITAEAQGDGGNITISGKPEFVILNNSQLRANAFEDDGGNIRIFAENFISSNNSIITASSEMAIDGQIEINAQEYELKNNFSLLPVNFLTSAVEYTKKACSRRSKNPDVARLAILGLQILPESPYTLGFYIPKELLATSTTELPVKPYKPCYHQPN